jgi:hypothetical protein
MILSQRSPRVDRRGGLPLMPGSEAFPIAGLRLAARCVETIPHSPGEPVPASAEVSRAAAVQRADLQLVRVHFAALHLATQRGVEIETTALSRTTSCPKVVARAQAWRHMDHSPTVGQLSKATSSVSKATLPVLEATSPKTQISETPTSKALALGGGVERRSGWTFTLGTCRTDFPRFASLPRSRCTVTSVRGSLGSCQGEKRSWLSFVFWRAGPNSRDFRRAGGSISRRARGPSRVPSASFQDQSRVFVPKRGRAPYIGAGEARRMLDGGGFGGASSDSQYPRRRQRPFIGTVRERHEPMSPPREELGARSI